MLGIKSKVDALVYAIEKTSVSTGIDMVKAEELYEFIIGKVDLPDVETDMQNECLKSMRALMNGLTSRLGYLHVGDNVVDSAGGEEGEEAATKK